MSTEATRLADQLAGGEIEERVAAVERLATLGPDAEPAAVALVTACDDPELRDLCVGVLEELGPPPEAQLDALTQLARSDEELVAYWAVTLIGRAGHAAASHAPTLRTLIAESSSKAVRDRALWALETPLLAGRGPPPGSEAFGPPRVLE